MLQKAELSYEADSENYLGGSSETIMYYIGLDVHKIADSPTEIEVLAFGTQATTLTLSRTK